MTKPAHLRNGEDYLLAILADIMYLGRRKSNRTGVDTIFVPGHMIRHDFKTGEFPLLTTKKMAFGQIKGELIGFIHGLSDASSFRELGCSIWDANANENPQWVNNNNRAGHDDLGRIYGVQWRRWSRYSGLDQFHKAIITLYENAYDRRNIVTAWNPLELDQMALPPCHLLWQLIANPTKGHTEIDDKGRGTLHMTMYMRSCDMFLGVPFNLASYGLLLCMISKACGWVPGTLTMFLADAHIYVNHFEQVQEILSRQPRALPTLNLLFDGDKSDPKSALECIESITPAQITVSGYDPYPPIKAEMAV